MKYLPLGKCEIIYCVNCEIKFVPKRAKHISHCVSNISHTVKCISLVPIGTNFVEKSTDKSRCFFSYDCTVKKIFPTNWRIALSSCTLLVKYRLTPMWNNLLTQIMKYCSVSLRNVKWNKSTHARRHFTRRRRISRTKCISQIPSGIYFVEKNRHSAAFSWSRVRESNPPLRLGKRPFYRWTNPAYSALYHIVLFLKSIFLH